MIGLVLVSHGGLAHEFIRTTGLILGKSVEGAQTVTIDARDDPGVVMDKISKAIKGADTGEGVIIFTDMFGGTPTNVALSFLQEGHVEVISGLNLAMLLQISTERNGRSLSEMANILKQTGRDNISLASDLLQGKGS